MLHIVLFQPEIPPNTGNIIRLAANTGAALHLIHPLGFELDSARARRAGLDYHELARVQEYDSLEQWRESVRPDRVFAITTRGHARYDQAGFQPGDALLFGPETRGLPESVLEALPPGQRLRLPMQPGSRSLNLSNAAAVVIYEAWRQLDFAGGD
ncbi:tRNA (cytidine(34)-2'-O)-methyltransferase [Thioalkalivibrio sp. ALJ16]|uniref:tRNA (cytidine(34)-2'-O)-methyltransferase n=1 Tax=Thioalkalivibrio sp. ALJ16 TaxID=1158762 RepID=UPI000370E573|nr:tRNA (cytidine(34)-2'-O)-methyltransferase [Thioalkalivibrio sp. ALJ16]